MQLRKLAIGTMLTIAAAAGTQSAALAFNFRPTHSTASEIGAPEVVLSQATQTTQFKVRIENISTKNQFTASNGTQWTQDFSPGVWCVSTKAATLFVPGQKDKGQGIEAIAEDGDPTNLAKALRNQPGVQSSAIFNMAVGATKVGGIRPGQAFEFTVTASPGQQLSFVTMFGQSNDWFYAPQVGIALFDANGQPIQGDVTNQIGLWNAGTEVDEEPGIGLNQGPRQKAPNTGVEENGTVQAVTNQAVYAQTSQLMRVTITPAR
jgi:Spondin_N